MEWIRVTDEFPHEKCLAIGYQNEIIIGYVAKKENKFICENDNEILENVTHWMPLPEPPTE